MVSTQSLACSLLASKCQPWADLQVGYGFKSLILEGREVSPGFIRLWLKCQVPCQSSSPRLHLRRKRRPQWIPPWQLNSLSRFPARTSQHLRRLHRFPIPLLAQHAHLQEEDLIKGEALTGGLEFLVGVRKMHLKKRLGKRHEFAGAAHSLR